MTWQEVNKVLLDEGRVLRGKRVAILRHEVSDTFNDSGLIVRPDTMQYEMLQGNIVLVGRDIEVSDGLVVGDVAAFNKYHVSKFEFVTAGGDTVEMDAIHMEDIYWTWSE